MIADRVSVNTATVGTGAVTLGAALPGFRSFAAAFPAPATTTVDYLIVEGVNWETGTGVFTLATGVLTRTPVASSAGGAAIALAGAAVVSVSYLSRTNVPDWPVMTVGRNGGATAFQTLPAAFTTLQLNTAPSIDTHGGFSTSTYLYTVPAGQDGVYDIQGKIRPIDATAASLGFGVGIDIANQDTPDFLWTTTSPSAQSVRRHGSYNSRLMPLVAGQQVRLFGFADAGNLAIVGASLTIARIR
jgi:hypothetical protein